MKQLYARLGLLLIGPALDLRKQREEEFGRHVQSTCKSWGYSGLFDASGALSSYWKERGCRGGVSEAIRRGLTGPDGREISR